MADPGCTRRLAKDYHMLLSHPPPYIAAHPEEDDILTWHYTFEGPDDSPYAGGRYHGKLLFPAEYPFKPPSVMMLTPNGRFRTGQRLCFSMSDFHPEDWNPQWTVSSILVGLLSFMLESSDTHGSIQTSTQERQRLARQSHEHNLQNATWCALFSDLAETSASVVKVTQQEKAAQGDVGGTAAPAGRAESPAQLPSSVSLDALGTFVAGLLCALVGYFLLSI
eukprot:Rhum_TRINITY_DN18700_c0_g1::Rhum_TRINITY_DN18700_c0_g1_i1::g.168153::m.168153/K04554/UBE2J2, NCUBE2, UBC6; ubiquitin-conjugating enzyme E2 J2